MNVSRAVFVSPRPKGPLVGVVTIVAFAVVAAGRSPASATTPRLIPQSSSAIASKSSAAALAKVYGLELRPPVAAGVPVLVVDAASRKPVADALVIIVEEWQFHWDHGCSVHEEPDAAAQLRRLGKAYATGVDGRTQVAPTNQPLAVFAWHDELFGRATIETTEHNEHVVELSNRDLRVEVVDKSGAPQPDVPVALAQCANSLDLVGAFHGVTGADGRLTIPAIDLEREANPSCGRQAVVTFDFPNSVFELRPIDVPRIAPVRLVIPACGTLDIELQDADGHSITDEATLCVNSSHVGKPKADGSPREDDIIGFSVRLKSRTGRFQFSRTQLGLDFDAYVHVHYRWIENLHVNGPKTPNEHVHAILRAESDTVTVRGRAVDSEHHPLSDVELSGSFMGETGGPDFSNDCKTDHDGRFALVADANLFGSGVSEHRRPVLCLARWDSIHLTSWETNRALAFVNTELTQEVKNRNLDVGDLELSPVPLLVRGRVVDDRGVPFFGAVVTIKGDAFQKVPWRYVFGFEMMTDVKGEFALWSPTPPGKLTISVCGGPGWYSKDLLSNEAIPLTPGDEHVQIEIVGKTRSGEVLPGK